MSDNSYRIVSTKSSLQIAQSTSIELIKDGYEVMINKQKYLFDIKITYWHIEEIIEILVKDKFLKVEYSTHVQKGDIFRDNIYLKDNESLEANKDIFSFKQSLNFLHLMFKNVLSDNSSDCKLTISLFKIIQSDFVFPQINNTELLKTLESENYIQSIADILETDMMILTLSYDRFIFTFNLNKKLLL
jgi:hypothetical protein